jgi:hypothetical protein
MNVENTCGRVVYIDLEGGFWAIETDDGRKLRPNAPIPRGLLREEMRVRFSFQPVNEVSFFMWGEPVFLIDIQAE